MKLITKKYFIVLLLSFTIGCNSDYTSNGLLLESRVTPLDISETGFWVAKEGVVAKKAIQRPVFEDLMKACKEIKPTPKGLYDIFKLSHCDEYVLDNAFEYFLQEINNKLIGQKIFIQNIDYILTNIIDENKGISKLLIDSMKSMNEEELSESEKKIKLESFFNNLMALDVDNYSRQIIKRMQKIGTVSDDIFSNPEGELIQYKGNDTYSHQTIGQKNNHTIQVFEHPKSGIMTKHYIAFYHSYDIYHYFFLSKERFGGWKYWVKDEVMAKSLWQPREFTSKKELIEFSNNVFNGLGFTEKPLFVKALAREDVLYFKKFQEMLKDIK